MKKTEKNFFIFTNTKIDKKERIIISSIKFLKEIRKFLTIFENILDKLKKN